MSGRYVLWAGCCLVLSTAIVVIVMIGQQIAGYGAPAVKGTDYLSDGTPPRPIIIPAASPESEIPAELLRQLSPVGSEIARAAIETQ